MEQTFLHPCFVTKYVKTRQVVEEKNSRNGRKDFLTPSDLQTLVKLNP